jgi:S1-C subfamily serine protease
MFDGRAQGDGVPVGAVVPASAAARAGLTEGDVIVRFDDIPVAGFAQFQQAVRRRRPGDRFTVVYLRDGQPRVGSETLDARP